MVSARNAVPVKFLTTGMAFQSWKLCAQFRVSYDNAQSGFRDFIDNGGVQVTAELAELDTAIKTLPVSSADAEQGFSTLNICNDLRNRLLVPRLSDLMFVSWSVRYWKNFSHCNT